MSKLQKAKNSTAHTRHFFELIRSIGESKSKQEEDKIIAKEVSVLKSKFSEEGNDGKTQRELVIRMVYCEMLGHFADFGYIHAIKLVSSSELPQKRVGYMATWLCIPPTHELVYLIVANLQKDLKSANFLEVCAALNTVNKLISPELIPCLFSDIIGLLKHPQASVRKKAILSVHAFFKKQETSIGDNRQYRIALCDKDPQVMAGALMLIHDVAAVNPEEQRDLAPSLVSILKQITEHRLTREYDYHRIPAPWVQIKILKILALVGADDKETSAKCYDVLAEVIKRADTGLNIGNAVIYEVIRTITSIVPHPELLDVAAEQIGKFLTSTSANLKYLGITALSRIVTIDPRHAAPHQHIVIDCLEDVDDTIRRKTLDLLYAMCNPRNVEVIVNRLTKYLEITRDPFLKQDMVRNLCQIIDRYSSSNMWYVDSLIRVIELGASYVHQDTLQGMLKLIAEGDGEDETEDMIFRTYCVEKFYGILGSTTQQSDQMYQVGSWVLGEYGFLCKKVSAQMMVDRLCDILERPHLETETKGWIVTACMKLIAQQRRIPDNIEEVVGALKDSASISLQQRCYEFTVLFNHLDTLAEILPLDGCCEDISVDCDLHVLDRYVNDSIARGAKKYDKEGKGGLVPQTKKEELKIGEYKLAQNNKVTEAEQTREMLEKEETKILLVSDQHKKWGKQNLEPQPEPQAAPAVEQQHVDPFDMGSVAIGGGSNPTQAAGVTAAAAPEKKKKTQKEKFADDLFGGLGGGPADAGGFEVRTKERKPKEKKKLEDLGFATAPAPVPTPTPVVAPSQPIAQPAVPKSQTAAPAPQPPKQHAQLDDLFGGGAPAPRVSSITNVASTRQFEYGPSLSSTVVSLYEDAVTVQMFLTTASRVQPYDIQFQLNPKVKSRSLDCNHPAAQITTDRIILPNTTSGQVVIQLATTLTDVPWSGTKAPTSIALCNLVLDGRPVAINVAAGDILRPVSISLDEFGGTWPTAPGEAIQAGINAGPHTWPDVVTSRLLQRANIKVVQVIGVELVAAAAVNVPGKSILVMVHLRVQGESGIVDATVRSQNKGLSEAVAKYLGDALK